MQDRPVREITEQARGIVAAPARAQTRDQCRELGQLAGEESAAVHGGKSG
jgi:hypothetical protein